MSRIGLKIIPLLSGISCSVANGKVIVKGPKGELDLLLPEKISVVADETSVTVSRSSEIKSVKQLHGTIRSRINNMTVGVSKGFEKKLEIQGVGYRAALQGKELNLSLGKSHPVLFQIPDGVEIKVDGNTNLTVSGIDKQLVGAAAAKIRAYYPPEPYKGKGIRYVGEYVIRKAGKSVAA